MYKVKNKIAPVNLRDLFDEISDINSYSTRSVTAGSFYKIRNTKVFLFKICSQSVERNTNTF